VIFVLVCISPDSPRFYLLWRDFWTANVPAQPGKVQISLDFTTGGRSIVTFRYVQATRRCQCASMPRGGTEIRRGLYLTPAGIGRGLSLEFDEICPVYSCIVI